MLASKCVIYQVNSGKFGEEVARQRLTSCATGEDGERLAACSQLCRTLQVRLLAK